MSLISTYRQWISFADYFHVCFMFVVDQFDTLRLVILTFKTTIKCFIRFVWNYVGWCQILVNELSKQIHPVEILAPLYPVGRFRPNLSGWEPCKWYSNIDFPTPPQACSPCGFWGVAAFCALKCGLMDAYRKITCAWMIENSLYVYYYILLSIFPNMQTRIASNT